LFSEHATLRDAALRREDLSTIIPEKSAVVASTPKMKKPAQKRKGNRGRPKKNIEPVPMGEADREILEMEQFSISVQTEAENVPVSETSATKQQSENILTANNISGLEDERGVVYFLNHLLCCLLIG